MDECSGWTSVGALAAGPSQGPDVSIWASFLTRLGVLEIHGGSDACEGPWPALPPELERQVYVDGRALNALVVSGPPE